MVRRRWKSRAGRPHAAVLDVNHARHGWSTRCSRNCAREGGPCRIVLLTARQQESDIIRGFTLGADDYVVKPFSPMELVAAPEATDRQMNSAELRKKTRGRTVLDRAPAMGSFLR